MNPAQPFSRFVAGLLAGLGLCFGLQAIVCYRLRAAAPKTESNYFSTLARFQAARTPGAAIALVGSSISGRIPGRESGNADIANFGADGGSPLDGIELLDDGVLPEPRWLIVETNTLFAQVGLQRIPVAEGTRGAWFRIGADLPLLGASARPSGMLYAGLLNRARPLSGDAFPLVAKPARFDAAASTPTHPFLAEETARLDELVRRLARVRATGTRILLVRYPSGAMTPWDLDRMTTATARLCRELEAPFIDLDAAIPRADLLFTDSVHLAPTSAARILATLRAACRDLDQTGPPS